MNHMRGLVVEMLKRLVAEGYSLHDDHNEPFTLEQIPMTCDEDLLSVYNNALYDMAWRV